MKNLIPVFIILVGFQISAMAAPIDKPALLKQVTNEVMIRAALAEAEKSGEICQPQVVSAIENAGAIAFEVQINCSVEGDSYTGGGVVLMINVKGRAFSTFLDDLLIKVDKAG
jgi:hypothetical protein